MKDTFGERLKELRTEKELSLKDLSQEIGIGVATLSNYERNERKPDFDTLINLSRYFNVTTDYLLCTTEIRNVFESAYSLPAAEFGMFISELDFNEKSIIYDITMTLYKDILTLSEFDRLDILPLIQDYYKHTHLTHKIILSMVYDNHKMLEVFRTYKKYKQDTIKTLDMFFEQCFNLDDEED